MFLLYTCNRQGKDIGTRTGLPTVCIHVDHIKSLKVTRHCGQSTHPRYHPNPYRADHQNSITELRLTKELLKHTLFENIIYQSQTGLSGKHQIRVTRKQGYEKSNDQPIGWQCQNLVSPINTKAEISKDNQQPIGCHCHNRVANHPTHNRRNPLH